MDHPTFPEVLESILETRIGRIHTAMPGKVLTYDSSTQTADVEPQLRLGGETLPVAPSVPVVWPLAYSDLSPSDTVLLIFCEGDIGLWRSQGQAGVPLDVGRHGLHGAVALAGLRTAGVLLDHIAGSTVLPGDDVRLSAYDASQRLLRADAWATELTRALPPGWPINPGGFLSELATWVAAVDALLPGSPIPATAPMLAAIATYAVQISGTAPWLSDEVKVP